MTHTLLKSKDVASPVQCPNRGYVVPASLVLQAESQNLAGLSFPALLLQNSCQLPSLGLPPLPPSNVAHCTFEGHGTLRSFLNRTSLGDNYQILP